MTIQECSNTVAIVQEYYRSFYKDYGKEETLKMINAWHFILDEYDYKQVQIGLKLFLTNDTKGYPPTPGMLINKVEVAKSNEMPELEAWARVRKSFRCSGEDAKEQHDKLPEILKKCVDVQFLIDGGRSDQNTITTVMMPMFLRTYRSIVARQKEIIPESIKALIEQNKLMGIEEKT